MPRAVLQPATWLAPPDASQPLRVSSLWAHPAKSYQRLVRSCCSAAIVVFAHLLMIGYAIGYNAKPVPHAQPLTQGPGSIAIVSDQDPVMTLILIDEPRPPRAETPPPTIDDLASRGFTPDIRLIKLLSPTADLPSDDSQTRAATTNSPSSSLDPVLRGVLFGRYVGQVNARIQRAWLRPRDAIGADRFSCRVLIQQDDKRHVIRTTLQACNGDVRWQLSLVRAIQRASPLPAPPDPRVFADALTLTFNAMPYELAANKDDYESPNE